MGQPFLPFFSHPVAIPRESRGVVFTKSWVVELVLDLAGYSSSRNIVDAVAIEPAAGEGAFLIPMARRLIAGCRAQGRPVADCSGSLVAYEIDEPSASKARHAVRAVLLAEGLSELDAATLATNWIQTGDFLLEAWRREGADFVIGNPPYIRLEQTPLEVAARYRAAYPTMRGRADIYVAFFEAALHLLKPGGVCTYICADRWMLNQYGAELRRLVTRSFGVEMVVEMHGADPFDEDVSAYPAITVIRRGAQQRAVVASLGAGAGSGGGACLAAALQAAGRGEEPALLPDVTVATVATWFSGSDPWPCGSPARLALLRAIEERFEPLESEVMRTKVGIGVATGCDQIFITRDQNLGASRSHPGRRRDSRFVDSTRDRLGRRGLVYLKALRRHGRDTHDHPHGRGHSEQLRSDRQRVADSGVRPATCRQPNRRRRAAPPPAPPLDLITKPTGPGVLRDTPRRRKADRARRRFGGIVAKSRRASR